MRSGLIVFAAVAALTVGAAQPQGQSVSEGDLLRTWLSAVVQHHPGQADAAASLVARWTLFDLERLLPILFFYLDGLRQAEIRNRTEPACTTCAASTYERERLLRLTRSRVPRASQALIASVPQSGRLDDLLLRAVSLHSDAAMLLPKVVRSSQWSSSVRPSNVLGIPEEIQSSDGQVVGAVGSVQHWYLSRALLQFLTPEPTANSTARHWYLAVSAYLAAHSEFAQIRPHLETMRALFPEDAVVMFDLGWLFEAYSTPRLQADLRALASNASRLSGGRRGSGTQNPYGIKPARESLIDAERYFARAVLLDPLSSEAHVRLAFAQTRLGRHPGAEATLRKLPTSQDPLVNFYAALVHGMTLEALDRLDDASGAYQKALALFPNAQSANLSMSALQQKRGDITLASMYAQRAIDPPANRATEFDPVVPYRIGRGRHVQDQWAAFYALLGRTP